MVYPPQARVEDLITLVSQVQKQRPTVRKMMSLLGLMSSAEKVIPWGRLHMRELQADLHGQWRRGESLESQIVLTPPSRADLQWWKEDSNLVAGLPLHPPTPQIELFTDSSTEGWGAHIESKTGSGLWSQEEKFLHINVLEMRAAHLAIRYFSQSLRNKIVLLASDNTSVVWYLKKQGGTKSRDLFLEAKHLFSTVMELGIILQARHVAGRLNVLADQLSRRGQVLKNEWSINPQIFKRVCKMMGRPLIDLFATQFNHKLPLYMSPIPDPRAVAVDALSQDWTGMWAYAFPPVEILHLVLSKIEREQCQVILIAPALPQASWYQTLLSLSVHTPIELPATKNLLKQVSIRQGSYKPGCNETPRLVLIQQALQKRGFSGQVSRMVSSSVRPSTNKVYDTKWNIFAAWCEKRKVCASKASTPLVADFLAEKQTLAPTTVEGYRTAISNTIKHVRGRDITSDPCIQSLIRSNRLRNTVTKNDVPPWDLAVVLRYLSKSPFEPIESSTLKNLTMKSIFLLALASGKRRGELQALTREGLSWNENKTVVTCRLDPSFEAKTQGRTGNPTSPIILHALSGFVGRDPDENLLCPVRSLLKYYTRVKLAGHVGNKKRLFVSINVGKTTEIASPTITRWIKTVILDAHRLVKDQDLRLAGVKAHQVRAVATSLTFKNASLEQVLEMGGWTNHSTFTSYYLKDLSHQNENQYRLAPILTGNVVVRI